MCVFYSLGVWQGKPVVEEFVLWVQKAATLSWAPGKLTDAQMLFWALWKPSALPICP